MKKIYYGIMGALCLGFTSANAQQLPNVGFSQWKSACGETQACLAGGILGTGALSESMRQRPGVEPEGWNGSSVNQKVSVATVKEILVTNTDNNATLVTKKVGAAGIESCAPGFITLGTPWVSAMKDLDECDGGVMGGIAFTNTPDAISVDVKRNDTNDENSYVIAYLWNGTFKSKIGKKTTPEFTHDDVDRAVLGKITAESNGTLVAKLEKTFKTTNGTETMVIPFEYVSDEAPAKANVIVCCGNYWDRTALQENTSVTTNNIKFIYYSTLASLNYNSNAVAGFAPDKYEYTIDEFMPENTLGFGFAAKGRSAQVATTLDAANKAVVIKVSNVGEDADGLKEHTYTVKFTKVGEKNNYEGFLNIAMTAGGSTLEIAKNQAATINIEQTGNNTCTFSLPNFSLDLGDGAENLGDIIVPNVTMTTNNGTTTYSGKVDGMKLLDGEITANVVINGTITAEGVADFAIGVKWLNEGTEIPIDVTFTTEKQVEKQEITGKVFIEMFGGQIVPDGQPAKVEIAEEADGKCTFSLPNFSLDLGDGAENLGDIVVPNVTATEANGTTTYKGHVDGMKLLEGAITANVDLDGTVDANGIAMMNIKVMWVNGDSEVPINVVFTNDPNYKPIAIEGIEADLNAPVEYFNLNGVRVNGENLQPGVYVRRQGSQVSKVLVK